jgi:hypothetical protein
MPEDRTLLERELQRVPVPSFTVDEFHRTRARRHRNRRIRVGIVAILVAALGALALARAFQFEATPADNGDGNGSQGIFVPYAGRILAEDTYDDLGGWINPDGPVDTEAGPGIADDVAATVLPEAFGAVALSSDGTQALLRGSDGDYLFPKQTLSILHADGTETPVTRKPIFQIGDATMSPDGSRIFLEGQGDLDDSILYTVDPQGGELLPFRIAGVDEDLGLPTFSPDGREIAFTVGTRDAEVWVANADGTGAHRILANAPIAFRDLTGLAWSPAGDRIAIGVGTHQSGGGSIYTFAPDGSHFTKVIATGSAPYWSPDGSRIAYTIQCDPDPVYTCVQFDPKAGLDPPGLAIADADGSNVRLFGFGTSGPWFPVG